MDKVNNKKINELERTIESLESELAASLEREALLQNTGGEGTQNFKEKFKRTSIGRVAADPRSSLGKIVRLPRTVFRIMMYPEVAKDILRKRSKSSRDISFEVKNKELFAPIKFFYDDNDQKRVNLVLNKIDLKMMKMAIELANKENAELRVVTCAEKADPMKYREWVKQKKMPKAKQITFYSSYDQNKKDKIFELEIGKNEVFLTEAWTENV